MTDRSETVVIGAGIIGLSLAYELARRGRRVAVLERDRPGAGATHAAAGMLAPISEAEIARPEEVAFGLDSLRRFPEFVRGIERVAAVSCGYRSEGCLWVATTRDDREQLEHLAETLRQKGLSTEPLSGDRLCCL